MARYNVHFPGGRRTTVWRPERKARITYKGGMFVPQAVLDNYWNQIANEMRQQQKRRFARVATSAVVDEVDIAAKEAVTELTMEIAGDYSAFYTLFAASGPIERQLSGLYRTMLQELTAEYKANIPHAWPRERGSRPGPVSAGAAGKNRFRLTGKIYRRIGGHLLSQDGHTIGFVFPDKEKLALTQAWRLELADSWEMPAGHFINGRFYPYWKDKEFKKEAGIEKLPKIPKSFKGDKRKQATGRRRKIANRNRQIMRRQDISYVPRGTITKESTPARPLQRAWNEVMGPKGEKVEKRMLEKIDQVFERDFSRLGT